ncbi:hypothetical protein [Tunturiibacter psychrotolerans]|uniref:hypothetical protein n=1 Tax=Tunturiibacter psychrotolerans TaxID=3069686 RepID=UPI003D23438E
MPDFMIHTGDITQNSKAAEFDTTAHVIKSAEADEDFYIPGEHDFIDDGEQHKQCFGKGTQANGWYIPHAHEIPQRTAGRTLLQRCWIRL